MRNLSDKIGERKYRFMFNKVLENHAVYVIMWVNVQSYRSQITL